MFLSVAIYFGLRTETVMKTMYENITDEFTINTKRNGLITLGDYENYMEQMGLGNSLFDITFEHTYKIHEPEYRFKTIEEIIEDQNRAYEGSNDYHYREVVTERPHVDDPINDGNLNTETNESILAKAEEGPPDPNHEHDNDCYGGHKHLGEPYFIHNHKHDVCLEYERTRYAILECRDCGNTSYWDLASWIWDEASKSIILIYSNNPHCSNCHSTNLRSVSQYSEYGYSCGYNIDINNDGLDDAVGYDNTYQYKKSDPQDSTTVITKEDGCYKYHQHIEFPTQYDYSGNPYYTADSLFEASNKGLKSYCKIPRSYSINWQSRTSGSSFRITYVASLDSNNLTFSSADSTYYSLRIPFPATMTMWEFARLTHAYEAEDFNERHYGVTFSDFERDYYLSISCNGELSRCNETIHNRWYTTCGLEEDGTPDCNKIIVLLEPTNPIQTVYANDPLITTAKATYKDGSTKIVLCASDFSTSSIGKDQIATLIYNYTIDGVPYSKNCEVTVTVIPRNATCPNGHIYNLNSDGSDPGCPYCRAWIDNLRIINPTTTPIVITIGTSLIENNVRLLATYMDGHTEVVTSGYIDNLDMGYLGTKPVTIGYKGASITVMVKTVCATLTCDICGYEYSLYPDGTNPGCPRCISKIPVFTGNIMVYKHINHMEEILEELYIKGQYNFNVNDKFKIKVTNKTSTLARGLLKKVYPSLTDRWLLIEKSESIMSK